MLQCGSGTFAVRKVYVGQTTWESRLVKKVIGVVGGVGKNAQCWRGRVLERRALWSVENYAMIGEVCFSAVQVPLLYAKSTFNLSK